MNAPAPEFVKSLGARIPMRALIVLGLVALAYPWSLLTLTEA